MVKYSPEEYQSLNLSGDDSKNMESLSQAAEKILEADEERAEELIISTGQERLVREAKKILYHTRDKQNHIIAEAKYLANENIPSEPILLKEQLDQESEYFSNAWKDSWSQKFYELVIEEVPNIGLSIVNREEFPDKTINKHCVAIKATPYKTDRLFLCDLELNPVIYFLRNPWFSKSLGKELEDKDVLPLGTTERVLANAYQKNIADLKAYITEYGSNPKTEEEIKRNQKHLAELGDVVPFSDEEAQELMREIIREEYHKNLLDDDEEEETIV